MHRHQGTAALRSEIVKKRHVPIRSRSVDNQVGSFDCIGQSAFIPEWIFL
ncbi:hypothetical protein J6524_10180 [Bradyrhizobium sp. WSM 1738]|nr:hypothetical protein [Bradyrhizobium hereditatis]MCA6115260.1 hypothetical protein [Bradyrhizobium hereditatis]